MNSLMKTTLLLLFVATCNSLYAQTYSCTGTTDTLFKENFGTASGTGRKYTTTLPVFVPGATSAYTLTNAISTPDGSYNIVNTTGAAGYQVWKDNFTDHTAPLDRGNMMLINCDNIKSNIYTAPMTVCAGTKLFFSFWVANICTTGTNRALPLLVLEVKNAGTLIASSPAISVPENEKWNEYGFWFDVPLGVSSLTLNIRNDQTNTVGNDMALDDIVVRMCRPSIATSGGSYCSGSNFNLTATTTDNTSTYLAGYDYQWYYSSDNIAAYTPLSGSFTTGGSSKTNTFSVTNAGYYKVAMANGGKLVNGTLPGSGMCAGTISAPVQLVQKALSECNPMPVKFVNFSVANVKDKILLKWEVAQDALNKNFTLQYSKNGRHFTSDATIPYNHGVTKYSYSVTPPATGTLYFRIMGTDHEGNVTYTNIKQAVSENSSSLSALTISPNPATNILNVQLAGNKVGNVDFMILDAKGAELLKSTKYLNSSSEKISLDIQTLKAGVYVLRVVAGNEIKNLKFVKAN